MAFFVVYLENKSFVVIKRDWIKNPVVGQKSSVFISANENAEADFKAAKGFYVVKTESLCYDGFVYKKFDCQLEAQQYVDRKRIVPPVQYSTCAKFEVNYTEPVEHIEISDSDSDSDSKLCGNDQSIELNENAQPVGIQPKDSHEFHGISADATVFASTSTFAAAPALFDTDPSKHSFSE